MSITEVYDDLNKRLAVEPADTLISRRAMHLAKAALQENLEADARGDTHFTHYFNREAQAMATQHRVAFIHYVRDYLKTAPLETQIESLNGFTKAWDGILPRQMMMIAGQVAQVFYSEWLSSQHVNALTKGVQSLAMTIGEHRRDDCWSILSSATNPRNCMKLGMASLHECARSAYDAGLKKPSLAPQMADDAARLQA